MFKAENRGGLTQQGIPGACLRLRIGAVSLNRGYLEHVKVFLWGNVVLFLSSEME